MLSLYRLVFPRAMRQQGLRCGGCKHKGTDRCCVCPSSVPNRALATILSHILQQFLLRKGGITNTGNFWDPKDVKDSQNLAPNLEWEWWLYVCRSGGELNLEGWSLWLARLEAILATRGLLDKRGTAALLAHGGFLLLSLLREGTQPADQHLQQQLIWHHTPHLQETRMDVGDDIGKTLCSLKGPLTRSSYLSTSWRQLYSTSAVIGADHFADKLTSAPPKKHLTERKGPLTKTKT